MVAVFLWVILKFFYKIFPVGIFFFLFFGLEPLPVDLKGGIADWHCGQGKIGQFDFCKVDAGGIYEEMIGGDILQGCDLSFQLDLIAFLH